MTKRKAKNKIGCFIGEDVKITGKMRDLIENECSSLRIIQIQNQLENYIETKPETKETLVIDYKEDPIKLDPYFKNLQTKTLDQMRELVIDSPANFYYFCWRGAFDDGKDMGTTMEIKEYKQSNPLFMAVKKLHHDYNLMKNPDILIGEFRHNGVNEVSPYSFPLSKMGTKLYNELKNCGFIDILKTFIEENSTACNSLEEFANWFNFAFYFSNRDEDYYFQVRLNELRQESNFSFPPKNIKINDKDEKNYFTISYGSDGEKTSLKIRTMKIEIFCLDLESSFSKEYSIDEILNIFNEPNNDFNIVKHYENFSRIFTINGTFKSLIVTDKKYKKEKYTNNDEYNGRNRLSESTNERYPSLKEIVGNDKILSPEIFFKLDEKWIDIEDFIEDLPTFKIYLKRMDKLPNNLQKKYHSILKIYIIKRFNSMKDQKYLKIRRNGDIKLTPAGLKRKEWLKKHPIKKIK